MGIFAGPAAAARGAKLLFSQPRLIALALIPAVVTLLLSLLGGWLALTYGHEAFLWLWREPEPGGWHWLWAFVDFFVKLLSIVGVIFITPWLVMLLGLPLCEPLASRADAILGGQEVKGTFFGDIMASLRTTLGLTLVGIAGSIGLFLLGLIPGVGLLTGPFMALVWTPLFLCFDLCDSSLARRQLRFRQKVNAVLKRPFSSISVGLTGSVLLAVPLINLFGLPIAVLAGVIRVRDLEERGELPKRA